jgi:hypothetical protein
VKRLLLVTLMIISLCALAFVAFPAPTAHADGCVIDQITVTFADGTFSCAGVGSAEYVAVVSIANPSGSGRVADFADTGPNIGDYTILSAETQSWSTGQGGLLTVA